MVARGVLFKISLLEHREIAGTILEILSCLAKFVIAFRKLGGSDRDGCVRACGRTYT